MENNVTPEEMPEVPAPVINSQEIEAGQETESQPVKDMVALIASQNKYVDDLEKSISTAETIDENEIVCSETCKAAILAQLVAVETYAKSLNTNSAEMTAVNALRSHLKKVYTKSEELRERARKKHEATEKDLATRQGMYETRLQSEGIMRDCDYESNGNTITLAVPENISSARLGKIAKVAGGIATAGSIASSIGLDEIGAGLQKTASITQKSTDLASTVMQQSPYDTLVSLFSNPSSRLEAQMDDLINEFSSKQTPEQKDLSMNWAGTLVKQLMSLKTPKAMENALTGAKDLSLVSQLLTGKGM